jgi:NAD(P)-dependent dehydrogenase (short-subunit alcohol dehydrogenase family)
VARALLERGARIAVVARQSWQVAKVYEALGRDRILCGHVATNDSEAAAGFVKGATDALGPIDALIAANGAFSANPAGKDKAGEMQSLLDANLLAGTNLARALVGRMLQRRAGRLVFIGSEAVGHAGAGMSNYCASKAALHEYVRALAMELRTGPVRAVALVPGTIDTEANRAAMPQADRSTWAPIESVVAALLHLALAPLPQDSGPLYPLASLR